MYQVIKYFTDIQDGHHPYNVGDSYPREGVEVTPERITELSTSRNKQGEPLIKIVEEQAEEAQVEEAQVENQVGDQEEKPKKPVKRSTKKAAEK